MNCCFGRFKLTICIGFLGGVLGVSFSFLPFLSFCLFVFVFGLFLVCFWSVFVLFLVLGLEGCDVGPCVPHIKMTLPCFVLVFGVLQETQTKPKQKEAKLRKNVFQSFLPFCWGGGWQQKK